MINKIQITIVCSLLICDPIAKLTLVSAGGGKSFFKKDDDKDKSLKSFDERSSDGGEKQQKRPHSLGMKFMDEMTWMQFQLGDRFSGGLPDGMISMARFCLEFIPKGLAALGYTQVRYPHKLVMKAQIFLIAIGLLKTTGIYCISPISMGRFITMAKIVNSVNDELIKIRDEFNTRVLNAYDKVDNAIDKMKHYMCAWMIYKRKSVDAVPEDAREFVRAMIDGYFKLTQTLMYALCDLSDEDFDSVCLHFQFFDDEPLFPLPRAIYTAPLLLAEHYL